MRLFACLFLILIAQNKTHTNKPQGSGQQKVDATCQDVPTIVNKCSAIDEAAADKKRSNATEKPPFMTHGEISISLITLAYVFIALLTLCAIKRQADNAVKIERAWIDIKLSGSTGISSYSLNVINHGRTVAKMKSWAVFPLAVPCKGTLGDRPEWPKKMLKRKELNRLITPERDAFLELIPVLNAFADEDWPMIRTMDKKAYFFVSVEYEDASGRLRNTKACYMYGIPAHMFVDLPYMKKWD